MKSNPWYVYYPFALLILIVPVIFHTYSYEHTSLNPINQSQTYNESLTPAIQIEPERISIYITAGQIVNQNLTIINTGSQPLNWIARELPGQPIQQSQPGNGTWLSRNPGGTVLAPGNNHQIIAHPAAYQWQPTSRNTITTPTILVYNDDMYHAAPSSYIDQALQYLGLAYTAYYDGNWDGFEAALATQTWDLILVENDNWTPPSSTLDALNLHVTLGGKLVYSSWNVGAQAAHPLFTKLGISWISNDDNPPDPIHWWDPDHPFFNNFFTSPAPVELVNNRYGINGQYVAALDGFLALAGYSPASNPDQAALVYGNNGKTVFKGYLDGQNDADMDEDSLPDGMELWANLVVTMSPIEFANLSWLSITPQSGLVAGNQSLLINVSMDTLAFTPGVYKEALIFYNNAPGMSPVIIPITIVFGPQHLYLPAVLR